MCSGKKKWASVIDWQMPISVSGELFENYNDKNVPYKSKGSPALGTHKLHNLTLIPVLVIGSQKPLELWYMTFGNHNQTLPFCDHIVVGEDHRCPLVAVVKNLGFHAVEEQLDGGVHRIGAVCKDGIDIFFSVVSIGRGGYFAARYSEDKLAEHSAVITKSQGLDLLRKRGFIFKEEVDSAHPFCWKTESYERFNITQSNINSIETLKSCQHLHCIMCFI